MTTNELHLSAHEGPVATRHEGGPNRQWLRALTRALAPRREADPAITTVVVLAANRARSVLVRGAPFSVRCVEGYVWITHPGDPGDHLLRAGDEFRATAPGHLVVWSLAPSRIVLSGSGRVRG